jgi:hypothetical protein
VFAFGTKIRGQQVNEDSVTIWKEAAVDLRKVLSRHLPGVPANNHEKLHSG